MSVQETLESLLRKNRNHEKATRPGVNNHVPMVLIALYRIGASTEIMNRYVENFGLSEVNALAVTVESNSITRENWQSRLGQGSFSAWVDFFEGWMKQSTTDAVLFESLPVLMTGVCTAAYHALLRLAYALDYQSKDEVVFALAYWAVEYYPGPEFDADASRVEPEAFFQEIVTAASALQIEPVNSIDGRLLQVYQARELARRWKPIKLSDSDPLENFSDLILQLFAKSQHFTLLHALTSCQAMRAVLPYLNEPEKNLSAYWHSVCAAYITVYRSKFEPGKDTVPICHMQWDEIFAEAASSKDSMEHIVKLSYASWLEHRHYHRPEYLGLACREIRRPSPFL
ncbi:MAG TPA: questin oxidase family protein [Terriglobia bacterium]|nr:questin oxidase family protein [Terriglobia bacterium]